jgi:hypothetical protein
VCRAQTFHLAKSRAARSLGRRGRRGPPRLNGAPKFFRKRSPERGSQAVFGVGLSHPSATMDRMTDHAGPPAAEGAEPLDAERGRSCSTASSGSPPPPTRPPRRQRRSRRRSQVPEWWSRSRGSPSTCSSPSRPASGAPTRGSSSPPARSSRPCPSSPGSSRPGRCRGRSSDRSPSRSAPSAPRSGARSTSGSPRRSTTTATSPQWTPTGSSTPSPWRCATRGRCGR